MGQALVGPPGPLWALAGPPGALWARPLWAPLGPCAPPQVVTRRHRFPWKIRVNPISCDHPLWGVHPGPLWAPLGPCRPPLGPYGPGPCGLPWALVGPPQMVTRRHRFPWKIRVNPISCDHPLWGGPPWALVGSPGPLQAPLGPLWAGPLWASLGPCGPGPCGPPGP